MTDDELIDLFLALFPDNNSREISEEDLRNGLYALLSALSGRIGDLENLTTTVNTNLVSAINTLQSQISGIEIISLQTGSDDPNVTPPANYTVSTFYLQQTNVGGTIVNIALWIYTGVEGIGWLNLIDLQDYDWVPVKTPIITPAPTWNFPQSKKGQAYILNFVNNKGIEQPNATTWVGGYSGVSCGHNTLVRCLVDSPGGSFEDVGFQFYIINSKAQNLILYYGGGVARPLVGKPGIIYYDTDTGATYIWNPITEEYDAHGAVIEGELVDSETFHDLSDNPVTPSGDNLYLDVVTDPDLPVIYKWNGSFYVPLSSYENGSVDSIVWVDNDMGSGQPKKLYIDPLTGEARIWNSVTSAFVKVCNWIKKLTDTATGVKVDGTIELTDFVATPANNTLSRNGDALKYTNSTGSVKDIAFTEQIYKTISGNTTLDDTYHNAIVKITANAIITVPSTLRADFNCVFDAIGTVAGTFTEGGGVTFSAPNGKVLKENAMCTLYKTASSAFRINGSMSTS